MSSNLAKLKAHCLPIRPAEFTEHQLFPLEMDTREGEKIRKAHSSSETYPELDPAGLTQSYSDPGTGLELPVFGVFELNGKATKTYNVSLHDQDMSAQLNCLDSKLPWTRVRNSLELKINQRPLKAREIGGYVSILWGMMICAFSVVGFWLAKEEKISPAFFFSFLPVAIGLLLLGWVFVETRWPIKMLRLRADFNGLLPASSRRIAHAAGADFDNLFIVTDQQGRWQSDLLADPHPPLTDPLLIGSKKICNEDRFFLLDAFDLTTAEDYLVAEFTTIKTEPAVPEA